MARGICHGSSQSDARTHAHSQSLCEIQPARSTDFARSAFGVRCVFVSLSSGQTDFRLRRRRFFFLRDKREPRRDRMMTLQPNQKIKDPHTPANGEAVATFPPSTAFTAGAGPSTLRGAKNTSMNSFVYHASTKRR